jgi:hypothetical protein
VRLVRLCRALPDELEELVLLARRLEAPQPGNTRAHALTRSLTHSLNHTRARAREHTYTHSDPRTHPHPRGRGVHTCGLGVRTQWRTPMQPGVRGQVAGLYDLVEAELCRGVRVNTVRPIYVSGLTMTIACRVVVSVGPRVVCCVDSLFAVADPRRCGRCSSPTSTASRACVRARSRCVQRGFVAAWSIHPSAAMCSNSVAMAPGRCAVSCAASVVRCPLCVFVCARHIPPVGV